MLLGNGNGSFQPAVTTDVLNSGAGNGNAQSVAVGDFNGDGLPDVALNTAGIPRAPRWKSCWAKATARSSRTT